MEETMKLELERRTNDAAYAVATALEKYLESGRSVRAWMHVADCLKVWQRARDGEAA